MKKYLFLIVLICCLLLCAAAFADREISVTTLDGVSGVIRVPVCNENGGTKTFALSNYQMSEGTIAYGTLGQKMVVLELSPKVINTSKGTPVTCLIPVVHPGTLQSGTNGSLILNAFTYSGDAEQEKAMTEDEWNTYKTYVSDINLLFSSEAVSATNDKDHNIDIHKKEPAYTLDIYGNSRIKIDGSIKVFISMERLKSDMDWRLTALPLRKLKQAS